MSTKKPVIHKSAIARPVDYSNAQIEVFIFLSHFTNGRRKADVARNVKCYSDGFNNGQVFSTGGRELKEAQVPYNPVDISSLPLGIVFRCLLDSTSRIHLSLPFSKKNFTHRRCVYCTRNLSHIVELKNDTF